MAVRICPSCGAQSPEDHQFCGRCGQKLEATGAAPGKTLFFGAMQAPGRAKLILIKGDGLDGVAYHLNATEHVAGRKDGDIVFADDSLLSPRHANFLYREGRLFVKDERSRNGIFVRIRKPTPSASGSTFLVGEQILQVETCEPDLGPQPDAEGTYYYASPRRPSRMRLLQRLRGGDVGMVYRARGDSLTIGRDGNDVNFPDDPFISGRHAQIELSEGRFLLTDLGSKNGTFLRISSEAPLEHGDYVFLGQQLLRVEVT
jgi:pSer/pThr/pTyr-binding forkhead associated (FHA) protein